MSPAMPNLPKEEPKSGACCAHSHNPPSSGEHSSGAFSRASHYGLALMPVVLGVAYVLFVRDAVGSGVFRLSVFALLCFGLGGAVFFLSGIDRVAAREQKH